MRHTKVPICPSEPQCVASLRPSSKGRGDVLVGNIESSSRPLYGHARRRRGVEMSRDVAKHTFLSYLRRGVIQGGFRLLGHLHQVMMRYLLPVRAGA